MGKTSRQGTVVKAAPHAVPEGYAQFLAQLKTRIANAQIRASLAANRELLRLYWRTGRDIVRRQDEAGWGRAVIERVAADLQQVFPGIAGFSASNLWRMRAFFLAYPADAAILAQPVRELASVSTEDDDRVPELPPLPWGHQVVLLQRVKAAADRAWYVREAIAHGWSRAVLTVHIEAELHRRQGRAVTNFVHTLPAPDSDLAHQTLKDPYVFDFLTLADDAKERDVEAQLTDHVQRFLLELGTGFAFVGRQVPLVTADHTYYLDLLFYHLRLRRYIVAELKAVPFTPEFVGKMNFYLSAVDDRLRHPDDGPTIGLLLCKGKDRLVAEYALRRVGSPIGVADWETQLVAALPEELRGSLPTVEALEAELDRSRPASPPVLSPAPAKRKRRSTRRR